MNILVITPGYLAVPAVNGGAIENLVDIITRENEQYKKANFNIIAVNDGKNMKEFNKENTKYIHINNKTYLFRLKRILCALINKLPNVYIGNSYIREVEKVLKNNKKDYDIVIIENNPLYILRVKKYIKAPIYLHLHNDYLNNKSKLNEKVYFMYDKILTVSNYIGTRVKTINNDKEKKIETLYNGIDLEMFRQDISFEEKNKIRNSYKIDKNDFVFLYIGRIIPQKGVKEMITAFNKICNKINNNVKLLIVGSSSFKNGKKNQYIKELKKLIDKNKENIVFTGYVDYKEIPKIYKVCDTQIVPSLWGEALGNIVIEGMAAGVPQIVNNIGGIPEMLEKNTALFCDENNLINSLEKNMLQVINSKEERLHLKNINKENVKKFDKKEFYNNYINNIEKINILKRGKK